MNALGSLIRTTPNTRPDFCEKHGDFTAENWLGGIWTGCPTCEAEEKQAEEAKAEAERRERELFRWRGLIGAAGIPERFREKSLDTFVAETPEQQRALRSAVRYANEFDDALRSGRSLMFLGKPGTGKTHLAAGIALQLMRENRRVLFTTVLRAVRRVKDTWVKGCNKSESDVIRELVMPDLLILDEVGVQFGSDFERNILFDLLNERYEACKPTLILSNLSLDEVGDFLGERIMDRLRENGGRAVLFSWESHRRG